MANDRLDRHRDSLRIDRVAVGDRFHRHIARLFTPKAEQMFYGLSLIPIAGFYRAVTADYGMETAWHVESAAVLAFGAIDLLGIRVPGAIIVRYPVDGLWDVLHELHAHGGFSGFNLGPALRFPLHTGPSAQPMTSASRRISIHGVWFGGPRGNPRPNNTGRHKRRASRHTAVEAGVSRASYDFCDPSASI